MVSLTTSCTAGGASVRTLTGALLVSVVLAGCSSPQDAPEPKAASAVVTVPAPLDRTAVAGLVPVQDSTNDPADQRSIATVAVPGEKSLDTKLKALAAAEVARYQTRLSPGVDNELNITWDPVLAAGPMLGVRLTARRYTGGAHSTTTSQSVYTDVTTGTTWASSALVADPEKLVTWVKQAVGTADLGHVEPDLAAVVTDLRFGDDGSVTVVLGQGETGAEALGEVAVRIDGTVVSQALTDAGKQIQNAALEADPFRGVPDPLSPSAEASSVAPVTGSPQPSTENGVDCATVKCVALTFDDGPGPYTARLLEELADKDVHATFFLIGGNVATQPNLVKREIAEGHAIGNHSWDHPQLSAMTSTEIADEVDRTAAAIKKAAGVTTDLLRPPYGATNDTVASVLRKRGDAQILWNVDTEDWKNRNAKITTNRALDGVRPGAIILMHDIHPTTVDAVPGIIDRLRAAGYTLVTVPQLLGKDVVPGKKYFNR